jgi:hypothetical protein
MEQSFVEHSSLSYEGKKIKVKKNCERTERTGDLKLTNVESAIYKGQRLVKKPERYIS